MVVQAIDDPGQVGLIANVYCKGCPDRNIGLFFHGIQRCLKKCQEFRGGLSRDPDLIGTGSCKQYGGFCFDFQSFTLRSVKVAVCSWTELPLKWNFELLKSGNFGRGRGGESFLAPTYLEAISPSSRAFLTALMRLLT